MEHFYQGVAPFCPAIMQHAITNWAQGASSAPRTQKKLEAPGFPTKL
jgi:hypothetical protein